MKNLMILLSLVFVANSYAQLNVPTGAVDNAAATANGAAASANGAAATTKATATDASAKANDAKAVGQDKLAKGKKAASDLMVNINTASKEDIQKLPGIGPQKAQAIINARPFTSAEGLKKVKGIKEGTIAKIKNKITF